MSGHRAMSFAAMRPDENRTNAIRRERFALDKRGSNLRLHEVREQAES